MRGPQRKRDRIWSPLAAPLPPPWPSPKRRRPRLGVSRPGLPLRRPPLPPLAGRGDRRVGMTRPRCLPPPPAREGSPSAKRDSHEKARATVCLGGRGTLAPSPACPAFALLGDARGTPSSAFLREGVMSLSMVPSLGRRPPSSGDETKVRPPRKPRRRGSSAAGGGGRGRDGRSPLGKGGSSARLCHNVTPQPRGPQLTVEASDGGRLLPFHHEGEVGLSQSVMSPAMAAKHWCLGTRLRASTCQEDSGCQRSFLLAFFTTGKQ